MDFPFGYERIAETTWAYLSSLLMLALFFKFNRFWSVRNFDLVLIILLAPGILFIQAGKQWIDQYNESKESVVIQTDNSSRALLDRGQPSDDNQVGGLEIGEGPARTERVVDLNLPGYELQRWGYYWIFGVGVIFLIRLLLDPTLVRRPLLEPNLSIGGLVFLGCSLMIFIFANIITSQPNSDDLRGARDAVKMLRREAPEASETIQLRRSGPGYTLFNVFPIIPSFGNGNEILAFGGLHGWRLLTRRSSGAAI